MGWLAHTLTRCHAVDEGGYPQRRGRVIRVASAICPVVSSDHTEPGGVGVRYPGMKPSVIAAAAAVSVLLGACSSTTTAGTTASSTTPAAGSASQASGGIVISGFAYSGSLRVKPGQKVTVTNQDSADHTLTDKQTHLFATGTIAASGGKGSFTAPTKPGSYPFGCSFHPAMQGTLVVAG